jgi:hypothetical protein
MPHSFINGFGGTLVLASGTLDIDTWTLNVNADPADTTNTGKR